MLKKQCIVTGVTQNFQVGRELVVALAGYGLRYAHALTDMNDQRQETDSIDLPRALTDHNPLWLTCVAEFDGLVIAGGWWDGKGRVAVIDRGTKQVICAISPDAMDKPRAMAIDWVSSTLYVSSAAARISVFSLQTPQRYIADALSSTFNESIVKIVAGYTPRGVLVHTRDLDGLSKDVTVCAVEAIAIDSSRQRLYFASQNAITACDVAKDGSPVTVVRKNYSQSFTGIAYLPSRDLVLFTQRGSNMIGALNGETLKEVSRVQGAGHATLVRVAPNNLVYVLEDQSWLGVYA